MDWSLIALTVIVLVVAFALYMLYRINELRGSGTSALLRELPADDGRAWRHGVVRYDDNALEYFRLRRVLPGPQRLVLRQVVTVSGRRSPTACEADFLDDSIVILELADRDGEFELALDSGGVTAFQSWLESRPSQRAQRRYRDD
ncbi:DUF2550 domain-containing protein [Nocardia sp. 348MFTsu5.1]|uniref:DUF2550 domain-containing protein n=1 Tax=Nocardia sp. 348MFTsu5.1 TaxID=1172185 RepID=UPI000376C25F|nr:DUF2550 domain-containing protein [Nocardia sp. 348MFTsu5.1]